MKSKAILRHSDISDHLKLKANTKCSYGTMNDFISVLAAISSTLKMLRVFDVRSLDGMHRWGRYGPPLSPLIRNILIAVN